VALFVWIAKRIAPTAVDDRIPVLVSFGVAAMENIFPRLSILTHFAMLTRDVISRLRAAW
jgi:hypothetical protein